VNGLRWHELFPSLHHRKEGWLLHLENFAKPPKLKQPGWFSFFTRKTTPASLSADASRHFINCLATPLAVMQGGE